MPSGRYAPLRNITRELLEPLWTNHSIPVAVIADRLGVTHQGLCFKAKSLGLPGRGKGKESQKKIDDDTFRKLWNAGVLVSDIAEFAGYSCGAAVSKRAKMMALPARRRARGASPKDGSGRCGWGGTITIRQFHEQEVARRMAQASGGVKVRASGGEDRSKMWRAAQ